MWRDKIPRQHFFFSADVALQIAIGIVDPYAGDRLVAFRRFGHEAVMRHRFYTGAKAEFGNVDIVLLVDEDIVRTVNKIPAA